MILRFNNIITPSERSAGVVVSGTAEALSRVHITWGSASHDVYTNSNGIWSSNFSASEIPTTSSSITAFATDAGGNGDDVLFGGSDFSSLTGGAGNDTFYYGSDYFFWSFNWNNGIGKTMILDFDKNSDTLNFTFSYDYNIDKFRNDYNNHLFSITGNGDDLILTFNNSSDTQLTLHDATDLNGSITLDQFVNEIGGLSRIAFNHLFVAS